MPIHTLFNTTVTVKNVSRGEANKQPIQTHGAAGDAIPARREHLDDDIMPLDHGEMVIQHYLFYLPADTTLKDGDTIVCESINYKVISVVDAEGMTTVDHIEARCIKRA